MGELKPGVTPAMAEEDLTAILRRVPEEPRDVQVHLIPLKEDLVGNVRMPLYATLGAAALILIVACINVAALLLARMVKREGEIALRSEPGRRSAANRATTFHRIDVVKRHWLHGRLADCLRRASTAGARSKFAVAAHGQRSFECAGFAGDDRDCHCDDHFFWMDFVGRLFPIKLIFGVASARDSNDPDARWSLALLVVGEIACSVMLTVSVCLLVHSFWRVIHVDPGFEPRVAAASLFANELLR